MLKIGKNYTFEDDWSGRQSCLMYFKEDDFASWSVDIGFAKGNFKGETIAASICINPIDTNKNSVQELAGEVFSITTIEESDNREDSFYIYEHEPMVSYKLEVLEIRNSKAHIKCNGILIVDGYAEPYEQEEFKIDSWIPVIESVQDWEKFGL
ncbi:hypothetical protein H0R90_08725 [Treponema putidum]|uniref:hypothetical protein n=1 Tax=Treponema putidum TaxID=221027 RepID=UPI0004F59925|nr:hypothetical protein [Treponema putidum]AIN93258.1 hypothetical protein JO40_03240 [Treponema putidum]TWI76627.1 hypothetical protein JM98_01717 [Treponema putidum]